MGRSDDGGHGGVLGAGRVVYEGDFVTKYVNFYRGIIVGGGDKMGSESHSACCSGE